MNKFVANEIRLGVFSSFRPDVNDLTSNIAACDWEDTDTSPCLSLGKT